MSVLALPPSAPVGSGWQAAMGYLSIPGVWRGAEIHHGAAHDHLDDLIVLCRDCHARHHGVLAPDPAA